MLSQPNLSLRARLAAACAALGTAVFFVFFLSIGLFFEGLVARDFARTVRSYTWTSTECFIVSSRISDRDSQGRRQESFFFEVEYNYTVGGSPHTSQQFALDHNGFADYGEIQRLALRFAPETKTFCFVNPAAPDQAILSRGNLWFGLVLLFPLVFVTFGAGGLFLTVRGALRQGRAAARVPFRPATPAADVAVPAPGRWNGVVLSGIFVLMGGGALWITALRPTLLILAARDWQRTPCVVVSSDVKHHSGDEGTTYSVNILYAYEVGGRAFRANRYHFKGGSSSGYAGQAAIVHRYPAGLESICFVNPRDPTDAVLERGFTSDMAWGLLPLGFVLAGFYVFYVVRRPRRATLAPDNHPAHSF